MGRIFRNIDWITVILLLLLALFGLFLLLSSDYSLFVQQCIYLSIGFLLAYAVSRVDKDVWWWASPFLYVLSIVFLFISYTGPEIRGATRWIQVFGIQLQPSELVKPFLILSFSWLIVKYTPRNVRNIPILAVLFIIPFFLVFRQPDLGTSLIYVCIFLSMLVAGGLDLRLVIAGLVLIFLFIPFASPFLAQYQKNRILTFLNPQMDPQGAGYNAIQATIAIGSGMLIGRGLGFGTQSHLRFLPEYHTDFIFASLVEELGFFGGALLIVMYTVLLGRILLTMRFKREDPFSFIYSIGLFTMILSQVCINTGMNMGILPVTGITLPFVSYGGSSLLSISAAFGVFWSLNPSLVRSARLSIT